ncbi:MAG: two-component regulator propeller domain-containing protein, partial [Bacteroidales bacterium]|nr:two-component regulator propeller domain-containing protein [Bacteroidales bacterium]
VWIGTESGVEKFVTQNNFITYENFSYNSTEDVSGIVKSIASDGNNLWVGYINNGLVRYSLKSKKSKHYKNFSKKNTKGNAGNINAILIDSKNNLWVSDWNSGLLKYNKENDNFDNISHAFFDKNRLIDNRIQRIIEGRPGMLWIGTEGGLNRYDTNKDEFKGYKHDYQDNNSLISNSIQSQAMVFDKDSNLWLGTWSFGLNKMEFTDSERINANFKRWKHLPDDSNSLPNNNVISLLYDTTVLWIGTFGHGLCKFDLDSEKFTNYTVEDGLPNNVIFAIMKDKNGNLWLSTDKGISMYDPVKDFFYNYTQEDGLQDNHFFWGAAFKDADGAIYFGGISGINKFIPELVQPDTASSKPVIVDIKLFNKSLDNQRYNLLTDKLSLYYYENFITIEFAALDYSEPKNNKYKYKLDGFDKDWISNNNINYASYSNLSPGEYTFMLQAANSNGVWSDETVSLKIQVIPPWWKTWIARIIFAVIIIGLAYSTHLVRINVLKKQKRKLIQLVDDRTLEISQKNSELKEKYEETVAQEEEIREQAEELRTLSEKLKGTNKLLAQKVKERTIELEKALYKAEDAQKLISSFLSNLSHEIRTPLNAIMGFSQLITNHDINLNTRDHYADIIEQNVNNLLAQIENIMDIAKLHTGQYQIKNTEFVLNDILAATYKEFKNSREYSHKNFSFNLKSDTSLKLFSDPAIFKNIIYNLVENAYKYTEKGTVEIGFRINLPENKNAKTYLLSKNTNIKLEIFVTDTGIGIPEKEQKIIFDAFRKVEHNNQKIYRGSGIGLALVKNLTEKLNGKIILQSEVDKGTSVILEFQLAEI